MRNGLKSVISIALVAIMLLNHLPVYALAGEPDVTQAKETNRVEIAVEHPRESSNDAFDYVLFSASEKESMHLNIDKVKIVGDVSANQEIAHYGSFFTVNGIIRASDRITTNGTSMVSGTTTEVKPINLPNLYTEALLNIQDGANQLNEPYSIEDSIIRIFSPVIAPQIKLLAENAADEKTSGDAGYIELASGILAEGDINLAADTLMTPGEMYTAIISHNGDITIKAKNITINGLIYAPGGKLTLDCETAVINGRIYADTVEIQGNAFTLNSMDYHERILPPLFLQVDTDTLSLDEQTGIYMCDEIPEMLSGRIFNRYDISRISYEINSQNGLKTGRITAAENWNLQMPPMAVGINVIRIVAEDTHDNSAEQILTIIYNGNAESSSSTFGDDNSGDVLAEKKDPEDISMETSAEQGISQTGDLEEQEIPANKESKAPDVVAVTELTGNISSTSLHYFGDVVITGSCSTYESNLIVEGDLIVEGNLDIAWKSNVEVIGDLCIQKRTEGGKYEETAGYLRVYTNSKLLVHGDLYTQSTNVNNGYITSDSTLELKGNLSQIGKNTYFREIHIRSEGTLLFTGEDEQEISFDRVDANAMLGNIMVANANNRLCLNTPVYGIVLLHNITLTGKYGFVTVPGISTTNGCLATIDGNMIAGNELSGKYLITGDMIIEGYVNIVLAGNVEVMGDLRIQKRLEGGGYGETTGSLVLGYDVKMLVHGDMYTQSISDSNGLFHDGGTLELKGNLTQLGTNTYFRYKRVSYEGMLLFTGEDEQEISFERVDAKARLGNIMVANANNRLCLNTPVYGIVLLHNITLTGKYGFVTVPGISTTNGCLATIDGNMIAGNELSGKYLITGDMIIEGYVNIVLAGNVEVMGDLRIQKRLEGGGYGETTGSLVLGYDVKMLVHGDMYTQSISDSNGLFHDGGTLELKGNLTQLGTNTYFRYKRVSYEGMLLFTGEDEQEISFERVDAKARLGNIMVANANNRLCLNTPVYGIVLLHNTDIIGKDGYVQVVNITDNEKTLHVVDSNLISQSNSIRGRWIIDGDFFFSTDVTSFLNQAYVEIGGDLRLQTKTGEDTCGTTSATFYLQDNAHVVVQGDLFLQSTASSIGLYGYSVLELRGNFVLHGNNTNILNNSQTATLLFNGGGLQNISAPGRTTTANLGRVAQGNSISRLYIEDSVFQMTAASDLNIGAASMSSLSLAGKTARVYGNGSFGTVFFDGGRLEGRQNITLTNGTTVGNGLLTTAGDLILSGSGYLTMMANSAISVGGTFKYLSSSSTTLTAGLLEIKGDFVQSGMGIFRSTQDAVVFFSGSGAHALEYPINQYSNSTRLFFYIVYANVPESNIFLPEGANAPWTYFTQGDFSVHFPTVITRHFGQMGVYAPTGNFSDSYTDMQVKTILGNISFTRTYNSLDDRTDSHMGHGFTFSHFMKLKVASDNVEITLPNGQTWNFTKQISGTETTYIAKDSRGVLTNDGRYVLTTLDNMRYVFDKSGGIAYMEDQTGNRLEFDTDGIQIFRMYDVAGTDVSFKYDSTGRLIRLVNNVSGQDVQYSYSENNLIKVTDMGGRTMSYTYAGAGGRLSQVTNNLGVVTDTLTYISSGEDKGKVATHTDSTGNTRTYSYGVIGGQTTITHSLASDDLRRIEIQTYDTVRDVTSSEKYAKYLNTEGNWVESNHQSEYVTYLLVSGENKYGEVQSQTDIYGNTTMYTHDNKGNITKITYPDGTIESFTYEAIGGRNCLTKSINRYGAATVYLYDQEGRTVFKRVQPINGSVNYSEKDDQSKYVITSYTYLNGTIKGLVETEINPLGGVTTYTYTPQGWLASMYQAQDEGGLLTNYEYDDHGLVTMERVSGNNLETKTTHYVYNASGEELRRSITGENAEKPTVIRTVRDSLGRVVQELYPLQYMESLDNVKKDTYGDSEAGTKYKYDNAGNLLTQTDALGNVTSYTYDFYGNPLTEQQSNGSSMLYVYDHMGRVIKVSRYDHTTGETNVQKTVEYLRRGMYVGIAITQYYGPNGTKPSTTEEWQDFEGKTVQYTDADGGRSLLVYLKDKLSKKIDAVGNTTAYGYDSIGRLSTVTTDFEDRSQSQMQYTYDLMGNVLTLQERSNLVGAGQTLEKRSFEYDCWGRLLTTVFYDKNKPVNYQHNSYDTLGRLLQQYHGLHAPLTFAGSSVVPSGDDEYSVKSYAYDYLGNVVLITDALGQSETISYDVAGNVIASTDRNGSQHTMQYDLLGRKVSERIEGSGAAIDRTYTYNNIGYLTQVQENGESTLYTYTGFGLVTGETTGEITKRYTYNNMDEMIESEVYQNGGLLQYTLRSYDSMGRLAGVADENGTGAKYTYDVASRLIQTTYTSGVTETIDYNAGGQVKALTNRSADDTILSEYNYTYYVNGSPATKTDISGTTRYTYDGLNRLTHVVYGDGTSDDYYFDDSGNRTKKVFTSPERTVDTVYSYDANDRMTSYIEDGVQVTLTYDNNGNLLRNESSEGAVSQSFDLFNRMASWTDSESVAIYTYYPSNMRKTKTVDGVTTTHVWIGDEIAADVSVSSTVGYLQGVRLICSDYGTYLYNAHGDVVQLVNDSGAVLQSYDYDAYGVQKADNPSDTNPYRYCGEYLDFETNTYYLRARNYSPITGRFLSEDTHWNPTNMIYGDNYVEINERQGNDSLSLNTYTYVPDMTAIMQSSNLYVYTGNNPILYVDSNGEIFMLVTGAIGVVAGGVGGAIYSYAKHGKVNWKNVAAGAAIGGAVGLTGGAAVAAVTTGSATASTAMVAVGVQMKIAGIATTGYTSFEAFKRAYGSAGQGKAWHHVVEQTTANVQRFGAEKIHNAANIVKIPHGARQLHNMISGHYSSIQSFTNGVTVRAWLGTQSFDEQLSYGLKILAQYAKELGIAIEYVK